jgi:hypothetical protein
MRLNVESDIIGYVIRFRKNIEGCPRPQPQTAAVVNSQSKILIISGFPKILYDDRKILLDNTERAVVGSLPDRARSN